MYVLGATVLVGSNKLHFWLSLSLSLVVVVEKLMRHFSFVFLFLINSEIFLLNPFKL